MTALIRKQKIMMLQNLLTGEYMSMEIAKYVKVHIIISCSNPYIFVLRETCLKYGR